jgi:hypothetical protein
MFNDSDYRFKNDRPSKFCVVTAYQDDLPWRTLGDIASSSNVAYCRRKGYGFRAFRSGWDTTRPMSWSKLKFISETLKHYEWVFWIDADAVITNHNVSLSSFITDNEDMVICSVQHISEAERHQSIINCGVFMLRSGDFANKLIDTLWGKTHRINHEWWEQMAFIEAYNESEDVRSRVKVMPAKTFNSVPPWRTTMSKDVKWTHGDFVVHFSAYPVGVRIGMMRRLLAWNKEDDPLFETCVDLGHEVVPRLRMRDSGFISGSDLEIAGPLLMRWLGRAYLIDPWKNIDGYHHSNSSEEELERLYQFVVDKCNTRPGTQVCRGDPVEVAKGIADECLDWVFIDGHKGSETILKELEAWWPKIRVGGLLYGTGYANQSMDVPGVHNAVTRFAASKFVCHRFSEAAWMPSWIIRKTGMSVTEPVVLDRDGLPALFAHRRYKRGCATGDRLGNWFDKMASECPNINWSSNGSEHWALNFDRHDLDWVYIDTDRDIRQELKEWWDKVRVGGIVCGSITRVEDKVAVDEFLAGLGAIATYTVLQNKKAWFVVKSGDVD